MVKGVELIIYNANGILLAAMEIGLLLTQGRYLGIDRDHRIGELEHAGEGVDKTVATDEYVAASTRLKPSIAIATEEDGGT